MQLGHTQMTSKIKTETHVITFVQVVANKWMNVINLNPNVQEHTHGSCAFNVYPSEHQKY